jgi:plasmid stability protein
MNITLKDIPEGLHHGLKTRAELHGRSLNKEVLTILESVVTPTRISPKTMLERIQERRGRLSHVVRDGELQKIIKEGR